MEYRDETKITLNFVDNYPKGLKLYLIKRYKNEINKLLKKLTLYFKEEVDICYTFGDDTENSWALDLDFYLVKNKAQFPMATVGKKAIELPCCFVICPPGYKKYGSEKRIIEKEIIFKVSKDPRGIVILYKKKVNNISWKRLFAEALKADLNKTKLYQGGSF